MEDESVVPWRSEGHFALSDQAGKAERGREAEFLSRSVFSLPVLMPPSLSLPLSDLGLVCTQCPAKGTPATFLELCAFVILIYKLDLGFVGLRRLLC